MERGGFDLLAWKHAIIPVMFPDAHLPVAVALFERGVHVTPFSYPVVPLGRARIRVHPEWSLAVVEDEAQRLRGVLAGVPEHRGSR